MRKMQILVAGLAVALIAVPVAAQPVVPDDFEVTVLATGLVQPKGLDSALFRAGAGRMGKDLFVAESGLDRVVTVEREGSMPVVFSMTNGSFPVGVGCFGGPFGPYLYCGNAMGGGIDRLDSEGVAVPFALPGMSIAGLAFGKGEFGGDLYAGEWTTGDIWRIDREGNAVLFATIPNGQSRYLHFSHGGPYGHYLYVTDFITGDIYRIDPDGNVMMFASTGAACLEGLAISPGGAFGQMLFAGDLCAGEIYAVAPDGTVTLWAYGFNGAADMIFEPGGKGGFTMFMVDGVDSVYAISPKK